MNLPITQFPSISPPMVNVTADYPGSNGELMIKSVIIPLEESVEWCSGYEIHDFGCEMMVKRVFQVVFNLVEIQTKLPSMFKIV
jgi:HAE1 family hydrophobic/amphiphilic exporter-1